MRLASLWIALGLATVVPVHQEPRHRPIHETEEFRVLDVRLAPDDPSDLHLHAHDIFYAVLDGSEVWSETREGVRRQARWDAGYLGDNTTHAAEPVVHRVGNSGDEPFRLIAIENLSPVDDRVPVERGRVPALGEPVVEDRRFRAWRVSLAPGESVPAHEHAYPCVVLVISAGSAVERDDGGATRGLARGDWVLRESGTVHRIENDGTNEVTVAEIEVRGPR